MKCARLAIAAGILLFIVGCGGGGSSVPPSTPDEILDFQKNTKNWEGKSLSMPLIAHPGKSISKQEFAEGTWNIPFEAKGTAGDGTPYDYMIVIAVPLGTYTSSMDEGDTFTVDFDCAQGDLNEGNSATALR